MNIARAIVDLLAACSCAAAIGLILSQPGIKTKRATALWFAVILGLLFGGSRGIPNNASGLIYIFFAAISYLAAIGSKPWKK